MILARESRAGAFFTLWTLTTAADPAYFNSKMIKEKVRVNFRNLLYRCCSVCCRTVIPVLTRYLSLESLYQINKILSIAYQIAIEFFFFVFYNMPPYSVYILSNFARTV